ncbi:MAG: hypothetical protein K0Q91_2197 [Fibrobacteria bacterium]|jgi:hypothetical protein|nr:hypothetical protein [Fibrobacteria bacterium]
MNAFTFSKITLGALTVAALGLFSAASAEVAAPRDAASGQATGKRQHQPGSPTCVEGETCTGAEVSAPRDAASGQATGKRTHKPIRATGDVNGDGAASEMEVTTARDAGSGMATGKRSAAQDHNSSRSNKTASVADGADADNDGVDAEGMAIKEQGLPASTYKAKAGKTGSAK